MYLVLCVCFSTVSRTGANPLFSDGFTPLLLGNVADISGILLETRDSLKLEYVVMMIGHVILLAMGLEN